MKSLLLAAAFSVPAAAFAAPVESASALADRDFAQASVLAGPLARASAALADNNGNEPFLQPALKPQPLRTNEAGAELARVNLASQLDRSLHIKNFTFGARALDLGLATDGAFKTYFFGFTDGSGTSLAPVGDVNRLRSDEGVDVQIDANTKYNFKAEISYMDPFHDTVLHMKPLTSGPSNDPNAGEILDAVRAQSVVITINGSEYWMLYGRNALADGSGFAATRSFLFIHLDGFSSKAYPLAESDLKPDAASVVKLGEASLQLTRTSGGELIVNAN